MLFSLRWPNEEAGRLVGEGAAGVSRHAPGLGPAVRPAWEGSWVRREGYAGGG